MRVHPIFSPDKLQQAADDSLSRQITEPPEPIVVANEQEWEVEEVLSSCLYWCRLHYQVRWIGFDENQTWCHGLGN